MLQKATDSINTPREIISNNPLFPAVGANVPTWDMIYVKDVMKGVVQDASDALKATVGSYLNTTNKSINFQYGDKTEINARMAEYAKGAQTKNNRFPMFGLIMPFKESKGTEFESSITFPEIIIAAITGPSETFDKRYEEYFKPIIYPVYQYFLISLSKKLNIPNLNPHRIRHFKEDVPRIIPKESGLDENIDAMRITQLIIPFINSKNNL